MNTVIEADRHLLPFNFKEVEFENHVINVQKGD
jgi:hypothetical protein